METKKKELILSSLVAQWVKDLAVSVMWLGSVLWHGPRFDPWPGNFCMLWVQPKKKKADFVEENNKIVDARGWGRGTWGNAVQRIRLLSDS